MSDITFRSLEADGAFEVELFDERLALRGLSAEAEKAEGKGGDIHFHTHESVRPLWVREVGLFEHADGARFARAADENNRPGGELCGHRLRGKRAAFRTAVLPRGAALCVCGAKFIRERLGGFARGMMRALPDLLLPQRVEAFDVGLKARLARWREDRCDAVAEAKADDFADDVWAIMRALKARIVIELRVGGDADFAPMFIEPHDGPRAGDGGIDPSVDARPNEAFGGEDVEKTDALNGQILDPIERIRIRLATRHSGQIPARRRSRAADATVGIQKPIAGENASDSAHARESHAGVRRGEFEGDGLRADKAQIALRGQRVTEGNNGGFERRGSLPSLRMRSAAEVQKRRFQRAGERLPHEPVLNAAKRDAQACGDGALREPLCA